MAYVAQTRGFDAPFVAMVVDLYRALARSLL